MPEKEPQYFKDFKKEFKDFVQIIARSFDSIEKRMATKADIEMLEYEMSVIHNEMATRKEVSKIADRIGRHGVQAQDTEEAALQGHASRIGALKKHVFA